MSDSTARSFRTCLMGGQPGVDTSAVVRAMHEGGFAVLERTAGENALAMAVSGEFDIVCWVATETDAATLHALSSIRDGGVPLIAILQETSAVLISDALIAGADACLAVDADAMVIRAQADAVLRRAAPRATENGTSEATVLQVGAITVDVERCEVTRSGTLVPLTPQEFRVVEYMARHAGRVLPAHEILNAVTDGYMYTARDAQDIFKATARRIRRKLEPAEAAPVHLVTVRGFGYRFEGDARGRVAETA